MDQREWAIPANVCGNSDTWHILEIFIGEFMIIFWAQPAKDGV